MAPSAPVRCGGPGLVGRHRLARLSWVGAALGWSGALAACGVPVSFSHHAPPSLHPTQKIGAKAHHGTPKVTHSPASSGSSSGEPASSGQFPSLVATALNSLASHTGLPLWGPTALPRGNSATATAGVSSFAVNVFACPTPEPLNGPGVGQGSCGAMASFGESFGATVYPSAAAALAQLPGPPVPSLSGYASRPMALPGNLVGTRWLMSGMSGPGDTLAIRWQEGDWTIWVTYSDARVVAEAVAVALQQYRLPPHPGVLVVDSAPDGQHTTIKWAVGDVVYQAGATHEAVHAIEIAATGAPLGAK